MRKIKNFFIQTFHPKNLQNFALQFFLKVNTVYCPCCYASYITFLPAGIEKRANAKCLKCGSLERHRALWLFLHQHTKIFSTKNRILHIAPEIQLYKAFSKNKNIDYHPIDLSPENYRYGAKTIAMDVTALKYPVDSFDVVICNHVLEHIPDDKTALREIYRVLCDGGWAILNVPVHKERDQTYEDFTITDPVQRKILFGQPDHVRVYGKDYITRLQDAGFHVEVNKFIDMYSHNEQFRYGIVPQEEIYYCSKKAKETPLNYDKNPA